AAAPVPSPMNQVSGRLGCAVPPQVQRQYHPGPAVEEQVEANEQANDPEARLGPATQDEDTEQQIDQPVEHDPRPGGELDGERSDDAQQAAHEEGGREQ